MPSDAFQLHATSPGTARDWAMKSVEKTVERQIRGHCWPIPVRDQSSHEQGWAFDSLLGAMWLQMLWLMLGARRCQWCGRLVDIAPETRQLEARISDPDAPPKPRSDRRFCRSRDGVKDKCKADYNYHRGSGTSNKHARKRERVRGYRARNKKS
jgi:hypothetical protein